MSITLKGKILPTGKTKMPNAELVLPELTGTGTTGRCVSLVGTNGLTSGSYATNSAGFGTTATMAFDGYHFQNIKVNADAVSPVGDGWFVSNNQKTNVWLSIDFGQVVGIAGFRSNNKAANTGSQPKNVNYQTSANGVDWTTHESFLLTTSADQTFEFSSMAVSRYHRLFIVDSYLSNAYIVWHEVELLQPE